MRTLLPQAVAGTLADPGTRKRHLEAPSREASAAPQDGVLAEAAPEKVMEDDEEDLTRQESIANSICLSFIRLD